MGRLETRTEDLFKEKLIAAGYTKENGITVDRQTCSNLVINELFSHASKNETGRAGYPDFIITNKTYPGIIFIAECKADSADHGKAAEEVMYYANFLRGKYDVILAAVSGTTETEFRISTAILRKDESVVTRNNQGYNDNVVLPLSDYEKWIGYSDRIKKAIENELSDIKDKINWVLFNSGDPSATRRMFILSACLLGLRDQAFRNSFNNYANADILDVMLQADERQLRNYNIPIDKRNTMMDNFKQLKQMTVLSSIAKTKDGYDVNPIKYILSTIHNSSLHHIFEGEEINTNIDFLAEFYYEFVSHGKKDDNGSSGFYLTPRHICDLFVELGEVDENTKVLDMCFGTGGFLVAAMQKEITLAKGDKQKIENIKKNNICGIELDGDRFTYGCVNMILRGDGQSNMIQGDCFSTESVSEMKKHLCSVGFINPPYSQPTNEFKFIENMLDCLDAGGRGIAIIPARCGSTTNNIQQVIKRRILSKHTLEAVISMPDQLFYPSSNTVTCIMIFTAHKPHNSERKTWFAYCKDDGFEINKKLGRADIKGKWAGIKKQWVDAFINRDEIPGFSLKQAVTADNEWSYEAYAKTDFSGITEESFKKVIKEYALFLLGQAKI